MAIPFTQYLMPDGRARPMLVDRPAPIEALAQGLVDRGYHFDIELLSTGLVSMTVEHPDQEIPIAHAISPNGPPISTAIDRLVREAASRVFAAAETSH